MSEAEAVFQELMFGTGAWFGLLLVLSLVVVMVYSFKRVGVLFFPMTLLLGVMYLNNSLPWHSLIMFISTAFILLNLAKDLKK